MSELPYEVVQPGMIRVCMHCYPGDSILKTFPELKVPGLEISHGLCPKCLARMKDELKRVTDP